VFFISHEIMFNTAFAGILPFIFLAKITNHFIDMLRAP